jgi:hypothetical protein
VVNVSHHRSSGILADGTKAKKLVTGFRCIARIYGPRLENVANFLSALIVAKGAVAGLTTAAETALSGH